MSRSSADAIVLAMLEPRELFEGPAPGRIIVPSTSTPDSDTVGAVLGEPGVTRMMRALYAHRDAHEIVLRFESRGSAGEDASSAQVLAALKSWLVARIAANRDLIRQVRRIGWRVLGICTLALGAILALSWALLNDTLLGPPGALRTLLGEAFVIVGWVVMWRPIELLIFDPLRPAMETRLLERAQAMPIRIEYRDGLK